MQESFSATTTPKLREVVPTNIAPPFSTTPVTQRARPQGNRLSFLGTALPLALLAGTALWGQTRHWMEARRQNSLLPPGTVSQSKAGEIGSAACSLLTGEPAQTREVTYQTASSPRQVLPLHQWNILCQTAGGQYLLRMNARTGQVYGINRVDTSPALEDSAQSTNPLLSATAAKEKALRYLHLVGGVSGSTLRCTDESGNIAEFKQYQLVNSVERSAGRFLANASVAPVPQWNFTFQRKVAGHGQRLIKVSVDGRDGSLDTFWNPVCAL